MLLRGTTHTLEQVEQLLIKPLPCKLLHDGSKPYTPFGSVEVRSDTFLKKYQLFPDGTNWAALRVNVDFYYDERQGVGTITISDKGVHVLCQNLRGILGVVIKAIAKADKLNLEGEGLEKLITEIHKEAEKPG